MRSGKEWTRCGVGRHSENWRVDLELRGRPRLCRRGVWGGWVTDGRRRWSLGVEDGALHCGGRAQNNAPFCREARILNARISECYLSQ